ncbi:MAG: N-formylglutamate amidohydrolase [Phormidesmis sp.]
MPNDLFTLRSPNAQAIPIVANLPHSGLQIPDEMAAQFTAQQRRSLPNSDWHLQRLYSFLPTLGITVLQANYSRYVVDLNRALKPPLFGSFWSAVVPEQTAFKQPIYLQKPSQIEVQQRIDAFYTPYHEQLSAVLNDAIAQFGQVTLLDLHSFMGLITDDVCLGNANGETCPEALIDQVAERFTQQGYQTVKNKVFTGGFITRHYGLQPQIAALQIELRYPTYLPDDQLKTDEIPQWQGERFEQAQERLREIFGAIAASQFGS